MGALMDGKHGSDGGDDSPLPARTPQESFAERSVLTQGNVIGDSTLPPDIDQEAFAMARKLLEILRDANMTKATEVSSNEQTPGLSPSQTQQAGPSSAGTSPFSQYSIHPESPEPSDQHPEPIATATETGKPPSPLSTPSRKARPFKASTHSQGSTIWMATDSYENLTDPPAPVSEDEPGILYIHRNLSNDTLQIWLLGDEKRWSSVQSGARTQHPILKDRYLSMRSDGTPSWVTLPSWYATKKRMNG